MDLSQHNYNHQDILISYKYVVVTIFLVLIYLAINTSLKRHSPVSSFPQSIYAY